MKYTITIRHLTFGSSTWRGVTDITADNYWLDFTDDAGRRVHTPFQGRSFIIELEES